VATGAEAGMTREQQRKQRDDWMGNLISNFGDDEGNEVNFNGTVVQALLMMNGNDLNKAIDPRGKGTLAQAFQKSAESAILNDLCLHALNRPPTANEIAAIHKAMQNSRDSVEARYQDVFWALLNTNDFILTHKGGKDCRNAASLGRARSPTRSPEARGLTAPHLRQFLDAGCRHQIRSQLPAIDGLAEHFDVAVDVSLQIDTRL